MTAKRKCVGKTWNINPRDCSGRVYSCTRNATIERDGQWWCWQHDPERVEADKKKRRAAENAKQDRRSAMYARRARNARLGALVTKEMAALLVRMGTTWTVKLDDKAYALTLAARIREALAMEGDDEPD